MIKTPQTIDLKGKGALENFVNTFSTFRETISLIYYFFLLLDWVPLGTNTEKLMMSCVQYP